MPSTRTQIYKPPVRGSSVTILSLLGEPEPISCTSTTKPQKLASKRQKPVLYQHAEIIDISSDDEPMPPLKSSYGHADLRRQLKILQEENDRCKADVTKFNGELAAARDELTKLKASKPSEGKVVLDISELEDNISCRICTIRLWSPHILSGCGHTFCQGCLQDWFNTTLARFMQSNPNYTPGTRATNHGQWEAMMQHPRNLHGPYLNAYAARMQQESPRPHYTCPTCREAVNSRPTEDFALKALIRAVTKAAGETSPKKLDKPKGAPLAMPISPWDGFFPTTH